MRWTITILVCNLLEKFEILRDFADYRVYRKLSTEINRVGGWFLYLISYKLGGSVTAGIGAGSAVITVYKYTLKHKINLIAKS